MSGVTPQDSAINPRAFVTATGFIFQVVGIVLACGGCGSWLLSGFLVDELDQPIVVLSDYAQENALPRTIILVGIVSTFVAGMGLVATGVGLQGENRTSGWWALAVTSMLALIWWIELVALVWISAALWKIVVAAFLAGLSTILFLLAGNSSRILALHPPPPGLNDISEEMLDEYSRKGHE